MLIRTFSATEFENELTLDYKSLEHRTASAKGGEPLALLRATCYQRKGIPETLVIGVWSAKLESGDVIILERELGRRFGDQPLPGLERGLEKFEEDTTQLCQRVGLERRGGVFELE